MNVKLVAAIKQHIKYYILPALLAISCWQCKTRNKVTYDIPADFPEARRQEIIGIFEKGKELYKANCAQCHGIFNRAKDSVPDFNIVQLDNYNARFMAGDPQNHAIARKMSREQLNQVLTFLRYKKTKVGDTAKHK